MDTAWLGILKTRKYERVMRGKEQGQQMEWIEFNKPKVGSEGRWTLCIGFLCFRGFLPVRKTYARMSDQR